MKKKALITGGTRGIGLGIARSLAQNGFDVAVNGIRKEKDVGPALQELRSYGTKVIYLQGNIALKEARNYLFTEMKKHLGGVNVLVNNAGVAPRMRKDILDINEEDYDYVMDINLKGTLFLTQVFSHWLLDQKANNPSFEGCVINISSISAEVASISRGEYCISKAGLSMLSRLLAVRLAESGIPVYEVRPGIIETDMTAGVKEKYETMIKEGLTLEQRLGQPDDVGKIVAALAQGNLPYATGLVITADGGLTLRRL